MRTSDPQQSSHGGASGPSLGSGHGWAVTRRIVRVGTVGIGRVACAAGAATSGRLRLFLALVVLATVASAVLTRLSGAPALRVAGLPAPRRAITVRELTPSAFNDRIAQLRRAALTTPVRCQRSALLELGLIHDVEPSVDVNVESVSEALSGAAALGAFYIAGSDTIVTVDRHAATITHEWVHAIDDQVSQRMHRARDAVTTDERIALRAAIEGTAIVASRSATLQRALTTDLDANAWVMAYGVGPRYVRHAAQDTAIGTHGAEAESMRRVLALVPATSYEVLFSDRPTPLVSLKPAIVGPGERILCSDEVGALGILTVLRHAPVTARSAQHIAHAWRGDRVDVIAGEAGTRRIVWLIVFGDSAARATWERYGAPYARLHSARSDILSAFVGQQRRSSLFDELGR